MEVQHFERGTTQRRATAKVVGKYRFRLVEQPQEHDGGFLLGRAEAIFDEPLPAAELAPELVEALADLDEGQVLHFASATAPALARNAMALLDVQLGHVGQGGRYVFLERFGDLPPTPAVGQPCTSAALERLSFFLLGALVTDAAERRRCWPPVTHVHGWSIAALGSRLPAVDLS